MKLYIFVCLTIKSVGGAQLYIRKKSDYLKSKGWIVKYVYPLDGLPYIEELCMQENLRLQELHFRTNYYNRYKRNLIIDKIVKFLGSGYEEVVLESHSPTLTSWGELVSKKMNARHIVYNINETVRCPKDYFEYYSFKCNRRELKGISKNSIPYFFKDYSHKLNVSDTCMIAYGASDSIFDVSYDMPYSNKNYTIGIVGRLEKEFVKDTFEDIGKFLDLHKNKLFNVVYVGGELTGQHIIKDKIEDYYRRNHCNVNLFFTGYIFPIPQCLVKSFNVCISGAGASREVSKFGIPTITIDPSTMIPNGVLWVDTNATIFNDGSNKKGFDISYYLEQIYKSPTDYVPKPVNINGGFDEHMEFLRNGVDEVDYFIHCFEKTKISYIFRRILTSIFPTQFLLKIGNHVSSLLARI